MLVVVVVVVDVVRIFVDAAWLAAQPSVPSSFVAFVVEFVVVVAETVFAVLLPLLPSPA